jgi:hypothetical protein
MPTRKIDCQPTNKRLPNNRCNLAELNFVYPIHEASINEAPLQIPDRERITRFLSRRRAWWEMRGSMRLIMKFLRNETGATAIEYGLIAAAFPW